MQISNLGNGTGDTLYLDSSGLLSAGIVTMGYFVPGITQSQIDFIR